MNAIRLTYAIEMIDQYYDNGEQDITIQTAFVDALGQEDGTAIYNKGKTWQSLVSMALRNELRIPLSDTQLVNSYGWQNWYKYIQQGADAIHSANSDVLIFLSGLDSDANLTAIFQGTALTPGTGTFNRDDFQGYGDDKLVLELHVYDNLYGPPTSNCSVITEKWFNAGFQALNSSAVNQFPLVVTEFGFPQNASTDEDAFLNPAVKTSTAPISDDGDNSGDSSGDGSADEPSSASALPRNQAGIILTLGFMAAVVLRSYW
ncbi:hypothetical protein ONZ43_g6573 [Nemania bipapillata]|uniref:Uncharacterized protein n=1 Tax=Nemania bipapillata TaxID=110536 RepID=A0ACC2HYB7_9PEZI|nr:hypothetical protein ONZ43_g6573 [Nemania bipapillata]